MPGVRRPFFFLFSFILFFGSLVQAQPCAELLVEEGAALLEAQGVSVSRFHFEGHPALLITMGERGLGRIARVAYRKYGTNLVFAPGALDSDAVGSFWPMTNVIVFGTEALTSKYEGVIYHELSHAKTEFHRQQGRPSLFHGKFSAREGHLPFVDPDSVYSRHIYLDELRTYLVEANVLLKSFQRVREKGSASEIEAHREQVLARYETIGKVLSQLMLSADLLRETVELHPEWVRRGVERGTETAVIKFSSGQNVYEAVVPLIRTPDQVFLSESEFLLSYFRKFHQRTAEIYMRVLEKELHIRSSAGFNASDR